MLAYFPTPYRGELLYSIFARYSDHMHFPAERGALQSLFSQTRHTVSVLYPADLD